MTDERPELRPRIVLGLPSHDGTYKWNCQITLENVTRHLHKHGFDVLPKKFMGSQLALFRHRIAQFAIEMGATHVLYVDSDTVCLDMAVVDRLLDCDKDIVSAVTVGKQPPFMPLATMRGKGPIAWEKLNSLPTDSLLEVDAVGFGFVLIKTSVFEAIPKGLFPLPRWFGCVTLGETDEPDTNEDYYFCWRAKEAGFRIYLDTGGDQMFHVGEFGFGLNEFRKFGQIQMDRRIAAAKAGKVGRV